MKIEDLNNVPDKPGVYFWKDKDDNIVYVGKANKLSTRMKQYLTGSLNSFKTNKMVQDIHSFDYVITNTSKDALILEREQIKLHAPKYNILLLDDKKYPYLSITLTDRLNIRVLYRVKQKANPNEILYGPFPTGYGIKRIADLLTRKYLLDKGLPIQKKQTPEFWKSKFLEIKEIFASRNKSFLNHLDKLMVQFADSENYEMAQEIKETIAALGMQKEKQGVELSNFDDIDFIGIHSHEGYISFCILHYRSGNLLSKKDYFIDIRINEEITIEEIVGNIYLKTIAPTKIYSNVKFDYESSEVIIPQKGKYKDALNIALVNAKDNFKIKELTYNKKKERILMTHKWLSEITKVSNLDNILMVDNSHTNNTLPVSVIINFRNGQEFTSRKYSLIVRERKADVDYMEQSLTKYFNKFENIKPDLLIVDGGIAQINAAKKVTTNIKIIGLSKDDNHKTKFLVTDDGVKHEIDSIEILNHLKFMQELVDKKAKQFHRKKTSGTLEGFLRKVQGLGPTREKKLLHEFKTYSNIYNATIEQLEKIVPHEVALNIKKALGEL